MCTGSLIAPDLVLTAGHCAHGSDDDGLAAILGTESWFGTGPSGEGMEDVLIPSINVWTHPDYGTDVSNYDVALMRLARPLDLPVITMDLSHGDAIVDQTARIVGFGASELQPPSIKREGVVTLASVDSHTIEYHPSPEITCAGDSGGPILIQTEAGEVQVGVVARGDPDCAEYGIAIRLDAVAEFILEAL